jgi:conjugative relaxase-like TrwC/TraI family protein
MLRVTTLYASSAVATAAYYTRYLAQAPGEEPGVWSGRQAEALGLAGTVVADDLQRLLEGRDPTTGTPLGHELVDRTTANGSVVQAVAGFDATFSAPKSVSVWWALTGDPGLLEAHDVAVAAALEHLERFGATTRVRADGHRLHLDTGGLSMATFRQTTSRADDPQVHTHAVVAAKVQTADGRWLALDARYLKRHQRTLGGLYQSVLRAELGHRYGVAWGPIVNGQAELAGMPQELVDVFSKRSAQVDDALAVKVMGFRERQGRDPTAWERAALTRESAADTRAHKTDVGVAALRSRWEHEAQALGWTGPVVAAELAAFGRGARDWPATTPVTVSDVLDGLSARGSTWTRADVIRAICDVQRPLSSIPGHQWAAAVERAADQVLDGCIDLDPTDPTSRRRRSDGRSVWIEPVAAQFTSDAILAEEERILTWALDAHSDQPAPSLTVQAEGLDVLQADAASAVAGHDRLVVIVGPAGAGKTTMLARAVDDLHRHGRAVFGLAPTAKAAHILGEETGTTADTVAKLLHEWNRLDGRPPRDRYRLATGTTILLDEASMLGTTSLARLVDLTEAQGWRLVLVGDPRQLQAVGRGGMFAELCATSRVHELARLHRFTHPWEAAASLRLRNGDSGVLEVYESHGRITAGGFDDHLHHLAREWMTVTAAGQSIAITASSNVHVDAVNAAVKAARLAAGQLSSVRVVPVGAGACVHVGDVIVTRRNDRRLLTSAGQPVRNRDRWIVTATLTDGALVASHLGGHGAVTLPGEYAREHVRLGYAATEHGHQGDTVDVAYELVTRATTHRGLYVGATRGRAANNFLVATDTADPAEAREVLEQVLANDRVDLPAVAQRRHLAAEVTPVARQPRAVLPGWLELCRTGSEDRRDSLVAARYERDERRQSAAQELAALQRELDAARAAWLPWAEPIARLDNELRGVLRPAMWQANHDAMRAGFGHRHTCRRHAATATAAVADAEAHLARLRADAIPARQRWVEVESEARRLNELAHPPQGTTPVDRWEQQELDRLDRVLAAISTWTEWAAGRPVTPKRLGDAFTILFEVARRAPPLSLDGEPDGAAWDRALRPMAHWLDGHGIAARVARHPDRFEVGVDLDL